MMGWAWVGWVVGSMAPAWAGTPVLYDAGESATVRAMVAERTGLPADQLAPIALSDLREQAPGVLGDAVIRRCTSRRATNGDVRAELARAEAALSEGDDVRLVDHLDLAVVKLGCLSEVVDAPAVARVFLLRGGVAAEAGRVDEAKGELATALALHDKVIWPAGYPTEGSDLLAAVAATAPAGQLEVEPAPSSGPWIDGKELPADAPMAVASGLHLAQHSARTGLESSWLVVGGSAVWTLPEALPPSALDAFADGAFDAVAESMMAAHADQPAAYVAHRGGLWLLVKEGRDVLVEQLAAPEPTAEEAASGGKKKKKKKGK